jgi:hypothetical protein
LVISRAPEKKAAAKRRIPKGVERLDSYKADGEKIGVGSSFGHLAVAKINRI